MYSTSSYHQTPSLPNELLNDIFIYLPSPSLAALSRVSHRYNAVAEHVLYSSIFIRDFLSESTPFPWRTFRCCESILARPHLVDNLKRFHIKWQKHPEVPPPTHVYFAPTVAKLHYTLGLLSFLEHLELSLGPVHTLSSTRGGEGAGAGAGGGMHVIERVIQTHSFPHLQSCSLGLEYTKLSPFFSDILPTFLSTLTSLRHLKLPEHCSTLVDLPTGSLQNLVSFRGSPGAAGCLLPGRPVQFLSLVGQDSDVSRENLLRITQTSVPLRYLDLSAMSVRPALIRNIATFLPDIEVLKVKLALRHTLHFALSGIRLLTGLSSVLNAFHHLIHLDLSPTAAIAGSTPSNASSDVDQELGLCREWARACPSLRRVVFPSRTEWVLSEQEDDWRVV
ncbi:hypothetical protein K435DRAFT_200797 [Dendrothele bispora CBS 962.96]|uniref:F-box domain-containing protein n=1 Tax=Dendrothele bispora (strain CBS 962.96) TaxID=1314807 RepID=A0A4S8LUD9_DENBC|nr:hypothetical protein K435DRAFT_200797 [Dendrothele bispora CBS 962.96]